jgi:hypothetical protein
MDPREQRRILKAQARAQRDMYKAQRDLYRRQSRMTVARAAGLRRNSILTPLIVIAVGVVLLIVRAGWVPFARFAAWYGHWWPLLFVAAGVVLVLEWALDQRMGTGDRPQVRRRAGGAIFLLLLVLAVTGAIVHTANDQDLWVHGFNINPDNWAEFIGDKHEREQTIDQTFPAGTSLSIENPHGDITVTGTSEDGQLHLVAYKQVYSESDAQADEKAQELAPRLQMQDGRLSVTVPWSSGSSVDLTVTVPASAQAAIDAGRGDVHITGLKGPVSVTADHGDVEVNDMHGSVTAHLNHRDSSFTAQSVDGDVMLKGNADDLNLTAVTGAVSLDGDFYGDTHLEHIGGTTSFRTSRTTLTFARLDGTIDISPEAELTGDQLVGPTLLTTRSRNINLQRVAGDVNLTDSNGTVELQAAAPLGNVVISNRGGAVTLSLPQDPGFDIQADTTDGEISNDFGLPVVSTNHTNGLNAKVGSGKSKVSISTTHGDVTLHRSAGIPAPPPAPPAPATPTSPKGAPKPRPVGGTVTF